MKSRLLDSGAILFLNQLVQQLQCLTQILAIDGHSGRRGSLMEPGQLKFS